MVAHLHGAKASPENDGYPENWTVPGKSVIYHYSNKQDAAMLWYHDHAMGINRLNVFAGLAGAYILRDGNGKSESAAAPGEYEIPRSFATERSIRIANCTIRNLAIRNLPGCRSSLVMRIRERKAVPLFGSGGATLSVPSVERVEREILPIPMIRMHQMEQIRLLAAPVPIQRIVIAPGDADLIIISGAEGRFN